MPTQLQFRRGNTAQTAIFTGAVAELTVDTDKKTIVIHDGVTTGGNPLATMSFAQAAYDAANNAGSNDIVTSSYRQANAAFIQANSAYYSQNTTGVYANSAYGQANTATLLAQSAYDSANNVTPQIQPSFDKANAAFDKANTAYTAASNSYNFTTQVNLFANAAYAQANSAASYANGSFVQANVAFNTANSGASYANSAFAVANNAVAKAGGTMTGDLLMTANIVPTVTNTYYLGSPDKVWHSLYVGPGSINIDGINLSNTGGSLAITTASGQTSDLTQIYNAANSAGVYANSAFVGANASFGTANSAASYANSAFTAANTADSKAVTADSKAVSAGSYANSAFTSANTADSKAVSAGSYANSAFTTANSKFSSSGGTITGDTTVVGDFTVTGTTFYANTVNLLVKDNIITLNSNVTGTPTQDSGIEVNRGNQSNTSLLWKESVKSWQFTNDGTTYSNVASASAESYANSAFVKANASYGQANSSALYANAAFAQANAAFASANNVAPQVAPAFNTANSAALYANSSFIQANSAFGTANSAASYGNSAFTAANTADGKAVSAGSYANSAFGTANSAGSYANSAFGTANSAASYANSAFTAANTADSKAVTSGSYANSAFTAANTADSNAVSAGSYANSAFLAANTADGKAVTSGVYANSAFLQANSSYTQANTSASAITVIQGVDLTQNTNITAADTKAQAAYNKANTGGTLTGVTHITDTTQSTTDTNGALYVDGGVGVAKNLNVGGDAIITGSLTVVGGTTSTSSTTVAYANPYISLHDPAGNTYISTNDGVDIGVQYEYFDDVGAATVVTGGSGNGTTATLNISDRFVTPVGEVIQISGIVPSGFNGSYIVTASSAGSVSFLNATNASVVTSGALGNAKRVTHVHLNSGTWSSQVANVAFTDTATGCTIPTGKWITITGCTPDKYNGTYQVLSSGPGYVRYTIGNPNPGSITVAGTMVLANRHAFSGWANDSGYFEFYKAGDFDATGSFGGLYGGIKVGKLIASAPQSISAADLTAGGFLQVPTTTIYDVTSVPNATVAQVTSVASLGVVTVDAANTGVTYTNGATLYIAGSPVAGHNTTFAGNTYSLEIASGKSWFGGDVEFHTANGIGYYDGTKQSTAAAPFAYSNASFLQANTGFGTANSAALYANAAFLQANASFGTANSGASYANSAFLAANTADSKAVTAGNYANSAYSQANTATTNAATADSKAVTAGSYANSAYSQANTATTNAATADGKAVTAGNYANSAYSQANTATTNAATADSKAVTAGSYANSAFLAANTADSKAVTAGNYANSAFTSANTADSKAVTAGNYANSAFGTANSAASYANAAFLQANSAFTTANNALPKAGGTITGDLSISGNLTVSGTQTFVNTTTVSTNDSLIQLAANNTVGDAVDIGFYGVVNTGSVTYTGLARQAGTNTYLLFKGLQNNPTGNSLAAGSLTAANAATLVANVAGYSITSNGVDLFVYTTNAYTQANTGVTNAATADAKAVTAGNYANSAYTQANTATTNAATADAKAVTAGSYANSAYTQANTATTNAATADSKAVTSGSYANSAFGTANSASSYANAAFLQANTGFGTANSSASYANSSFLQANSAFSTANNALPKAGGVITGTVSSNSPIIASSFTANTGITIGTVGFDTSNTYTTSSVSQVTVDTFPTTTYRSARYFVQMTSSTNYHIIELFMVHDGTTVSMTQYGEVFTNATLGSFDANIVTGAVNLLFTPTNSATTVKLIRRSIVV